jgi:YD repeat-containing protein
MRVEPSPVARPVSPERTPKAVVAAMFVIGIVLAALLLELWLMRTSFVSAAREQLLHESRVTAEFGKDVAMPLAIGWSMNGSASVLGYVKGSEASGFAVLDMYRGPNGWVLGRGKVHDTAEAHVLTLGSTIPVARADQLHSKRRLYLVALGPSATNEIADLAKFLQAECGVEATVLPAMELPREALDVKRDQWIAEMLVDAMAEKFPDVAGDGDARIIGVIDGDIYPRSLGWDFTFNLRVAGKYAVLQTAGLDPGSSGHRPSPAIRTERLRKTAMKCLGLLYFGFEESRNPESLMSFEGTLRSIDESSEHYLLSDLATRTSSDDMEGIPCLAFSSVNLGGLPPMDLVHPCWEPESLSPGSDYQVDLSHGEFRTERTDIYRSGPSPFVLRRTYGSHVYDGKVKAFGKSTWQNLDDTVWSTDPQSIQTISIYGVEFKRITPGVGFSPIAKYVAPGNSGEFSHALLSWEGRWKIQGRDGTVWHYLGCSPNSTIPCYFMDEINPDGDRVTVQRDNLGHIQKAMQTPGADLPKSYAHSWTFTYDGEKVRTIEDGEGGSVRYLYDADGFLKDVDGGGHKVHYDYDNAHRMSAVTEDGRILKVHYDPEGRVEEIDFADHPQYRIRYSGETVVVTAPSGTFVVKLRDTFFHLNRPE